MMNDKEMTAKYDGYSSCPVVTGYDTVMLAEFVYGYEAKESFPIDQRKQRHSMHFMKKNILPMMYWNGMERIKTLESFREGAVQVLVATDVAGRGIHIEDVSHVINYTLPEDPEDYVHRIGRTGRAGATGVSISFVGEEDAFSLPEIERYIQDKLPCEHPPEGLL